MTQFALFAALLGLIAVALVISPLWKGSRPLELALAPAPLTPRVERRSAAWRRSRSCSTWRLSCCSERRRWLRSDGAATRSAR